MGTIKFNRLTLAFTSLLLTAILSSCGESNRIAVEPFIIYKVEQSDSDAERNIYHYRSVKFKKRTGEFISYSKYNISDTISFQPCR